MTLEDERAATRTTLNSASEKEKLLVHHKEKHFTAGDMVWDVIIGVSDGLTIPFTLAAGLFGASTPSSSLPHRHPPALVDALRSLQSPSSDAAAVRNQAIHFTAIAVATLPYPLPPSDASHLESLVELLLAVANHPNHGPDRLSHVLPCESLHELEHAHLLLLSDVVGHLWALTQAERTHAAQSYLLLLLAAVVRNIALTASFPPFPPSSPPPPPSFPSPPPNPFFPLPTPIASHLNSI